MNIEFCIIGLVLLAIAGFCIYLFFCIQNILEYLDSQMALLARTFETYYDTKNIEPRGVNWGIDLIWNPNNENIDEKKGFITIYYGEDSGIDTPIDEVVEADKLGGEIIKIVEKHLKDKEMGL